MDLAQALTELWRRKLLIVVGLVFAIAAAVLTVYDVPEKLPPRFEKKSLQYGTAQVKLVVDAPNSPIANLTRDLAPLSTRAGVYARLVDTAEVKRLIGARMGIPPEAIGTGATPGESRATRGREVSAMERSGEIAVEENGYRIVANAVPDSPIISVLTQGPTGDEAARLADATADGIRAYIKQIQDEEQVRPEYRIELLQPGAALGGMVNEGVDKQMVALAFGGTLVGWCLLILLGVHLRNSTRERHAELLAAQELHRPSTNGHGDLSPEQRKLVHP